MEEQKNKIIFYTQKYKFIILTVFLLLITVGVTATGLYFLSKDFFNSNLQDVQNQDNFVVKNISLSEEQKQEIYKKILKRNVAFLDNLNNLNSANLENSGQKNSDTRVATSLSREFPFVKGLTKTTTQYKIGNKECKAIFDKHSLYGKSSTSWTYIDKDKYYSKYIHEDTELGFLDLTISNVDYKNGINFDIYYKGGNYAVKHDTSSNMLIQNEDVSQEEVTNSNEQNEVIEDNIDITQYIGPNADIIGEADYNGTKVYVIRYSDNVNCNDINFVSTDKPHKLVYELFVEQKEFSIVRNATYLDSVDSQNLVYEFITSSELKKDVSFEEVKDLFDFDINVEIKEFKEPKYDFEAYQQKQKDYFNSLSFDFLRPTEGNIKNLHAFLYQNEIPEYQKYLESREFFPKGKLGDELYKKYGAKESVNKILNYLMDVDDLRWNFYLLESKSVDEVINKNFKNGGFDVQSIDKVNLKISGENIKATRIKYSYEVYDLPAIGSTSQDMPKDMPKTVEYAFLFLYKGNLYEISVTRNNFSNDSNNEYGVDISNYSLSAFRKNTVEFKALSDAFLNNLGIDNVKVYSN